MIAYSLFLGDFSEDSTVPLCYVPEDSLDGAQMRALHVLARETIEPDRQNYWICQIGKLKAGSFTLLSAEQSFAGGFPGGVSIRIALEDPTLLTRGDMLALRLLSRGEPSPIVGLSVTPEWGILAARRL